MAHDAPGPGRVIASRFRLEEQLEDISGASMWRAVDLALARNVAVHVVPADDDRAERTLRAARTSATVSDPRLARVLDAVEEDGLVHVVHEWCTGASLDRLLGEGVLEPRRAAWLVREVADALAVAHQRGVPHGRLLPENVMVSDAGSVQVIGFVVAAELYGDVGSVDEDVRNLAALLYASLVDRWPGTPDSVLEPALVEHGHVLRPRQVRAGVPRSLDTVCDRLLNGTAEPRLRSAAGVSQALSAFLGEAVGDTLGGGEATTLLAPVREDAPAPGRSEDPEATQAAGFAALVEEVRHHEAPGATQAVPLRSSTSGPVWPPPEPRPVGPVRTLPPAASWGPDRRDDTGDVHRVTEEAPGAPWLKGAGVLGVVALIALAAVIALNLRGGDPASTPSGDTTTSSAPSRPLTLASVRDFDPDQDGGTPEENPDQVPLATDGDPATAWTTLQYRDGPELAPYKSGVGLLLDLGSEKQVGKVQVTLLGSPYDVQLLAAPSGASAPTGTDGLDAVATRTGVGGQVVLQPDDRVTTRYLVLWLTALPASGSQFQGKVAEVTVRS